ncbi:MFS transporter [Nocardioides sp.]|uniref:MFS transporter n=1 Tax=Nocardioides sp. TaxID=35761 RepID=UPI002B9B8CF3|nr:MFS transporter [Nocardioides sp.]HVX55717.1 MFS transporter [Nocardioides sp.]
MTSEEQRWRDPHPGPDEDEMIPSGAQRAAQAARATARGLAATGRGVGRFSRFAVRTARRAADAQGASESGLNRLIEMHAFNTAGDAAVAISLAGSLFFSMPGSGGESSRSHVALFLGLTMLPFAIVAPLLGPFLDRIAHGRRWAIGATMAARAFLCWILADALPHQSPAMFPSALGVLVASKAYGVTRAAAVPRLLPRGFTLVKGNGRVSMSGMVGVAISAPVAGLCSLAGPEWVLRWATVLFVAATICAIRLPGAVDSNKGEGSLTFGPSERGSDGRMKVRIPSGVAFALRANCAPKWLYGFLLMFMAFLLQEHPLDGWNSTLLLGIVAGGAGVGNFLGVTAASLMRRIRPAYTVTVVLVADAAVALVGALFYSIPVLALIGLVAGLGQALAKFSLDSTIQRDVPEQVQTSAFARSDTTLQLAWVVGGFVGIGLPLHAHLGMWVAFAVLTSWCAYVLTTRPRRLRGVPEAP